MAAPTTVDELLDLLRKSNLLEPGRLDGYLTANPQRFESPTDLCHQMRVDGLISPFHAEQLMRGKHRGYFLGKYKLLDRIGFGGMGQVFLAEHTSMKRRVALKVLPPDRAANEYSRERFLREARAAGRLDHPNLVRAFDIDQDGEIIFLVMEYVDGASLHDLVARSGPLSAERAGYYLWQAAYGLAHLHACGLVHRDIKPANLIVDRQGVVKILDLGLVRSEADGDDLTRGEGVRILGTADYLAPEQAINCSQVDIRADIYGLGATGYFLLTGRPPFEGDKVAQKLIAHQVKKPRAVRDLRPDVPRGFSDVIARMMAKKPDERFQTPTELAAALAVWAQTVPPLPTELEIPPLSAAVTGTMSAGGATTTRTGGSSLSRAVASSAGGSGVRFNADGLTAAHARMVGAAVQTPPPAAPVPLAPTTVTPAPRPAPTRSTTSPRGPRPAPPPLLPAAATHGAAPPPPPDQNDPLVFAPARPSWDDPSAPAQPASFSRRWIALSVALCLVVAVGTWEVLVLTGWGSPPTADETPDPVPSVSPREGPAGRPAGAPSNQRS